MIAIIATGGKQYLVTPGQTITIEKILTEAGQAVTFSDVLMIHDQKTEVGTPLLTGARVTGQVVAHGRARKVIGIKFHSKVRYRRKFGHRQPWTKVKIDKISG